MDVVRALRARAGILLLITNEFSTKPQGVLKYATLQNLTLDEL